ncbi:hypothetical protein KAR91_84950 [Candidatus Pacearchaeota archaeon]|nr:hypothetical protein [Candidatus Pacearchaeota archaeon]
MTKKFIERIRPAFIKGVVELGLTEEQAVIYTDKLLEVDDMPDDLYSMGVMLGRLPSNEALEAASKSVGTTASELNAKAKSLKENKE